MHLSLSHSSIVRLVSTRLTGTDRTGLPSAMQPMRVTSELSTCTSQGLPIALHRGADFAGYGAQSRRQACHGLASNGFNPSRPAKSSIRFGTFLSVLEDSLDMYQGDVDVGNGNSDEAIIWTTRLTNFSVTVHERRGSLCDHPLQCSKWKLPKKSGQIRNSSPLVIGFVNSSTLSQVCPSFLPLVSGNSTRTLQ